MVITTNQVCTAGYQGESIESFLEKLVQAHVTLLVDVRRRPMSRKPGFSKRSLGQCLNEAGIRYIHLQYLGMPDDLIPLRNAKDNTPILDEYRIRIGDNFDQLRPLRELAGRHRICLLCFEADHTQCHRGVLADFLYSDQIEIVHL